VNVDLNISTNLKTYKEAIMGESDKLKKLMSEANVNQQLRGELLRNPEKVAKEWKVDLGEEEISRLKKLNALTDLVAEVKNGRISSCDPRVCYPVTIWEHSVFKDLIGELLQHWRNPIFYRIGYPIGYPAERFKGNLFELGSRPGLATRAGRRFFPDEIFYPVDRFSRLYERLRDDLTNRLEILLEEKLNLKR
jgi:hypothetical protein